MRPGGRVREDRRRDGTIVGARPWHDEEELVLVRVDQSQRRRQIAAVVARLWAARGSRGCTIRAVARELGVSLTVVTNAFGTSAAMLEYTLLSLLDAWEAAGDALLERDAPPAARLKELLASQCPLSAEGFDDARIWMDATAARERPAWISAACARYDAWLGDRVARLLRECGVDPRFAPVLLVAVFGLNAAPVQSPEAWPPECVAAILDDVLGSILGVAG
jgi:AcrR family transcriptional regulator